MLIENIKMALHAIRSNKMRSFLTMLGIIIGISSVISIVTIGDTMRKMFEDVYRNIGVTMGYVMVSWNVDQFRDGDFFTLDEMERIREVFGDDIAYMDCDALYQGEATYGRKKEKYTFTGIDYQFSQVQPLNMIYGRDFNEGDIKGRKNNVIIENKGALSLFGTENAVGKTMRMVVYGAPMEFNVIGVYKKDQSPLEAILMNNGDRQEGYIPYTILTWPNDYFQSIKIYGKDEQTVQDLFARLRAYVANLKGRPVEEIMVISAIDEMGSVDTVMGSLSAAVGGIAAISLLVGGIGIMNIMLVSVTERTREIGIRKALGAKTRDVLVQFLIESAFLSASGGVIGIVLGAGLVLLGGSLFGLEVVIQPGVIVLSVGFSALVGVFFGIYPASKAAKSDPIEALRYE